jgi:hypothetical protein
MQRLELFLFETDPVRARAAHDRGVDGFMFDIERLGKVGRQSSFDTEISAISLDKLSDFVAVSQIRPICRLDSLHDGTAEQIERAIDGAAGELLFPMVRSAREIEHLLSLVAGRVPSGIMIETVDILKDLPEVSTMPLSRVYVGLNDLMISSGHRNLFDAMIDGTVDRIRNDIGGLRFGIAGATRVDLGSPLPFRLLLAEMARLEVHFTMLRRSFRRDVGINNMAQAVHDIARLWQLLGQRSAAQIAADREAFVAAVGSLGVFGRQ